MFTRPMLSMSDAQQLVDFMMDEIERQPGWRPAAVAVVDDQGNLMAFLSEDDCNMFGREMSVNKAVPASFRRSGLRPRQTPSSPRVEKPVLSLSKQGMGASARGGEAPCVAESVV